METQIIKVQQLKLLPFEQLHNLQKYLHAIEAQFIISDPYHLYLYIMKNPTLTSQQIYAIVNIKQPIQIIKQIFSQQLFNKHIDNISLLNSFTILRLTQDPISNQTIKQLYFSYFPSLHKRLEDQIETERISQIDICKEIFGLLKFWHSTSLVNTTQLLNVLQQIFERLQKKDLENEFKLVELIISFDNYTNLGFLTASEKFKKDMIQVLMWWNNGVCTFLVPNIYLEFAKFHKDQCSQVDTFMDLFSTLNCWGVHLIKDLWNQFINLCNSKTKLNYISLDTLMSILLRKVAEHNNQNIPKNCIRDLLKSQGLDMITLFTEHQNVVYNELIPVLNRAHFYVDSPLQKDSKFSNYVVKFFSNAYNRMNEQTLNYHLKILISSMNKWLTYDQALPAFLIIFNHITIQTAFFSNEQSKAVVKFLQRNYGNVHMRKRWQIVNGILECLTRFLSPEIQFQQLLTVIMAIPDDAYQWIFVHDQDETETSYTHKFNIKKKIIKILESSKKQQLISTLNEMSQLSSNDSKIATNFYRLMRINKWIPFKDMSKKISQLSKSSYTQQKQLDILILQISYQSVNTIPQNWKMNDTLALIKFYLLEHYHHIYEGQIKSIISSITKNILINQNQNNRYQLAKFVDFLVYTISESPAAECLYLTYQILLSIIQLQYSISQQQLQIQQSIYEISTKINSLKTPKQNKYSSIKLRLQIALSLLLSKDKSFSYTIRQQFLSDPLTLVNRYDYEYYPQLIYFLIQLYTPIALKQQRHTQIDRVQQLLLSSILTNLQYTVRKQDIDAFIDFLIDDRFLQSQVLWKQGYITKWMHTLIKSGSGIVYIHRIIGNKFYKYLKINYQQLRKQQLILSYVDIIYEFLQLQENRGFDSQVAFYQQEKQIEVIQLRKSLPEKAEYYGMYIRFLFMKFLSDVVNINEEYQPNQKRFLTSLGQKILMFSINDESANRMIFSPSFRTKLRLWQAMNILIPYYLKSQNKKQTLGMTELLVKQLDQTNQPQIKHYIQVFITRIILHYPTNFIPIMIQKLKVESSLSHSISNVIIAGLILKQIFDLDLYNALLSLMCHNTAYLRGLTQYFCFYDFKLFEDKIQKDSLVRKLYSQFLENPDSLRLAERVHSLINNYQYQLKNTNIDYYCKLEINKLGQIVEQYVQDGLKKIGLEIVKQIKYNDQGYILMKDLWKRQADTFLRKSSTFIQPQTKGFQKKIDPIIEEIYSTEKLPSITKLRILASNLESIYNNGHLVRTGQIFSLQQLAVKSINILSDDNFKSVSCTGQKWLNIKQVPLNKSLSYILQCIQQGYQPVIIQQNSNSSTLFQHKISQKTLLILPNEQKQFPEYIFQLPKLTRLNIGAGLSVHVQSAIFMWQYIRKVVLPK